MRIDDAAERTGLLRKRLLAGQEGLSELTRDLARLEESIAAEAEVARKLAGFLKGSRHLSSEALTRRVRELRVVKVVTEALELLDGFGDRATAIRTALTDARGVADELFEEPVTSWRN